MGGFIDFGFESPNCPASQKWFSGGVAEAETRRKYCVIGMLQPRKPIS